MRFQGDIAKGCISEVCRASLTHVDGKTNSKEGSGVKISKVLQKDHWPTKGIFLKPAAHH